MKLPNADQAIIEERKVRDYLLSPTHPIGRLKAAWFAELGYIQKHWWQLETDLREYHLGHQAKEVGSPKYGIKYSIKALLVGPNGKRVELVSIWIIRTGEDRPRLVTAYPGGL